MLNQVVLVGRITADPKLENLKDGQKFGKLTLAVQRTYKNADGVYETDFIDCELRNNIAVQTAEYCHKGDLIGVKGTIKTLDYESENGEKLRKAEIVADKLTFLASKVKDTEENKNNDYEL